MILVYSYKNAVNVFRMLEENKLVTLNIYKAEIEGEEENKKEHYLINYSTIKDYPLRERAGIEVLFDRNIDITVKAVSELREFIEKAETNSIAVYRYSYSIKKPEIVVNKQYLQDSDTVEKTDVEKLRDIFDNLETLITKLGIHNIPTSLYRKVMQQNSKRPKYAQAEVCEVINALRQLEICDTPETE